MQAELRRLFHDAVKAFAVSEQLTVEFPNLSFKPPVKTDDPNDDRANHYLSVSTSPARPVVVTVDKGESRHRWIMQIMVYARDDIGELRPLRYADKIRKEVFPIHSVLDGSEHTFKVMTQPHPAQPLPEKGWFAIPVSFEVQAFN